MIIFFVALWFQKYGSHVAIPSFSPWPRTVYFSPPNPVHELKMCSVQFGIFHRDNFERCKMHWMMKERKIRAYCLSWVHQCTVKSDWYFWDLRATKMWWESCDEKWRYMETLTQKVPENINSLQCLSYIKIHFCPFISFWSSPLPALVLSRHHLLLKFSLAVLVLWLG